MPDQIQVVSIRDVTEVGPDGRPRYTIRVEFLVGQYGPFVESISREHFSAAVLRQRMEAIAREIEQLPMPEKPAPTPYMPPPLPRK